jgi:hypothetical protein
MEEPLHHKALSELLYDVIPKFTDLAHFNFRQNPDPRSFFLQFERILGPLKYSFADSKEPDLDSLYGIADLLEHLVDEKNVGKPFD